MSSFQRLAVWTTATTYVLILVGGLVRASGAGLGCPDWPRCFGSWIPPASAAELPAPFDASQFNPTLMWTEYLNRLLGVTVGFLIFATLISAIRHHRRVAGDSLADRRGVSADRLSRVARRPRRRARAGGVDRDGAPARRAGDRVAARCTRRCTRSIGPTRVGRRSHRRGSMSRRSGVSPGCTMALIAVTLAQVDARRAGPRAGGRGARRGHAADGGAGHGRRLRPLASGYRSRGGRWNRPAPAARGHADRGPASRCPGWPMSPPASSACKSPSAWRWPTLGLTPALQVAHLSTSSLLLGSQTVLFLLARWLR